MEAAFQRNIGNFNKISKLETPQNLHVKQRRIPIIPVLQVGRLRQRAHKSFRQSYKKRGGELEKDPELWFTRKAHLTQAKSSYDLKTQDKNFA